MRGITFISRIVADYAEHRVVFLLKAQQSDFNSSFHQNCQQFLCQWMSTGRILPKQQLSGRLNDHVWTPSFDGLLILPAAGLVESVFEAEGHSWRDNVIAICLLLLGVTETCYALTGE